MPQKSLFVVLVAAISCLSQFSTTHALTVDLGAAKDNTLYEDPNGSLSNGAGPSFFAGTNGAAEIRRGLLQFDVAGGIPAGATITSAALTLFMSREGSDISETIELHRVLAEWGEAGSVADQGAGGGGAGGAAQTGDATWTHRFTPTDAWTTVGGDFSATVSAAQSILGIDSYTWGSTAQMVGDVQDWLDNPATNFGWIVLGNEMFGQTAKRFDSRENTTSANRPKLTIEYELSGPTADFTGEGDVDGADLAIWEASYAIDDGGDTDGDNDTDGIDFLNWQEQYTGTAMLRAVPEPSCGLLLLLSAAMTTRVRYRL